MIRTERCIGLVNHGFSSQSGGGSRPICYHTRLWSCKIIPVLPQRHGRASGTTITRKAAQTPFVDFGRDEQPTVSPTRHTHHMIIRQFGGLPGFRLPILPFADCISSQKTLFISSLIYFSADSLSPNCSGHIETLSGCVRILITHRRVDRDCPNHNVNFPLRS
jgi:hypothetical protein